MKNYKKSIFFLVSLAIFSSCELDKLKTIEEDFEIKVSADPVVSKINLKIFNAKGGEEIPTEVKVVFEGTDSDKIFSGNGSKSYKVENGYITLGVNRNFPVSETAPISVNATVSASGFISKTREINFNGQDIREVQVGLLEKSNLPESIVLNSISETLSNNRTISEISVSMRSNNNPEEILEFTIPENTSFFDENDNLVSGATLTADFQTFDTEAPDENDIPAPEENAETLFGGANEFPGGLSLGTSSESKSLVSKSQAKAQFAQSYLVPINSVSCFYMFVNGKRVYRFSSPMLVKTYVYRDAINPNTNRRVAVGDEASVYYYNRTTRKKEKITSALIKSDGRGFYVEFNAPKPGVYPVGIERSLNNACNSINSIKFVNTGRRSFYWYTVAHKSNPRRAIRYGYMYFDGVNDINNNSIDFWPNRALTLLGEDMVLKIYNYSRQTRRYKVVYNEEISVCELDGKTIDISNGDCFTDRELDLSLKCPDATYLLNNVYVYYKKENDRYFSYFDRVVNSKLNGKSPCLETGVKYEFGFWYGGWKVTPPLTEAEMTNLYNNFDLPTICKTIKDF